MKTRQRFVVATLLTVVVACSGGDADDLAPARDASEVTRGLVPGAVAAEIALEPKLQRIHPAKVTVARSEKLRAVASAFKPQRGAEAVVRCAAAYAVKVRWFDEHGKELARATSVCGIGTISRGDDENERAMKIDSTALVELLREPSTPADALWGITKITLAEVGKAPVTTTNASAIAGLIGAVDRDAALEAEARDACSSGIRATFYRGAEERATLDFGCAGPSTASLRKGTFTMVSGRANAVAGDLTIDPQPFRALL